MQHHTSGAAHQHIWSHRVLSTTYADVPALFFAHVPAVVGLISAQSVTGCYTEHHPFGEPTRGSMGKATPNRDKND